MHQSVFETATQHCHFRFPASSSVCHTELTAGTAMCSLHHSASQCCSCALLAYSGAMKVEPTAAPNSAKPSAYVTALAWWLLAAGGVAQEPQTAYQHAHCYNKHKHPQQAIAILGCAFMAVLSLYICVSHFHTNSS